MNYPSRKDEWKKFEKNHVTIALNVLYVKELIYILPTFQKQLQITKNKSFF